MSAAASSNTRAEIALLRRWSALTLTAVLALACSTAELSGAAAPVADTASANDATAVYAAAADAAADMTGAEYRARSQATVALLPGDEDVGPAPNLPDAAASQADAAEAPAQADAASVGAELDAALLDANATAAGDIAEPAGSPADVASSLDGVTADSSQAGAVQADGVQADAVQADAVQADAVQADSIQADSWQADAPPLPSPTLPPDAPTDTNLIVTVTGLVDGIGGEVSIGLEGSGGDGGTGKVGTDPNAIAVAGPTPVATKTGALPMTFYLHTAPGPWQPLAWVKNSSGFMIAGGVLCSGKTAGSVQVASSGIASATVQVMTLFGPGGLNKICSLGDAGSFATPLSQVDVVFTPATKDGAAHFMQSMVKGPRLWVAGSQDGYVSFDFPSDPALSKPLANWSVHGGPMCNRLVESSGTLYCSSRNGYLHKGELTPNGAMSTLDQVWLSSNGSLGSEGMAVVDGHIYIAAHRKGIWRIDTSLGSKIVEVAPPAGCDIWDVRQLDPAHLIVASNMGLHVVTLALVGSTQSPWGAFAPTPGVAGNLHVDGTRVWVGDLSGQVHLYELSDLTQPLLLGSVSVPSSAYGVWGQGDHGYAAAGHYVVAIDVPPSGKGPLLIRGASRSPRFALDVDPLDATTLMAAEFQDVRRLHIEPSKGQDGPVLMTQPVVYAAMAATGTKILGSLRVYNAGQVEAKIAKLEVQEAVGNGVQVKMGPWIVAPGQLATIPFQMSKMKKGVTDHTITLFTDPLQAEPLTVPFIETTWLHPGDTLPPTQYKDLSGKLWDVNATLQGKVGVVLIAAHSCPVGFMGMATAARHLKPWMDAGQLAVVGINPWDTDSAPEVPILELPFPMLHSPLTTKDGHDWSEVLDATLGQPIPFGPPMPIVYVVGKNGKIALAQWGYAPMLIAKVIEEELAKP